MTRLTRSVGNKNDSSCSRRPCLVLASACGKGDSLSV